jgi:cystathionine beta-lyase/cystathionine gamma-synthase
MTRDSALVDELRSWRTLGGGILGPMEAWLAIRGLRTLPLRIERQSANALAIASHLVSHPRVTAVHYPGVGHRADVARAQMSRGFGPLLSFEIDGTAADADAVVAASRLIVPASSFGGVESAWERRGRWQGETAPDALIRISVGIEPPDDLIGDIDRALAHGRPIS